MTWGQINAAQCSMTPGYIDMYSTAGGQGQEWSVLLKNKGECEDDLYRST